jgi:beta-galactosidase
VSDASAEVLLTAHVRNDSRKAFTGVVEYELQQPDGTQVAFLNDKVQVRPGKAITSKDKITVKNPMLWSPETPTLYNLIVRIRDREGNVVDGYRRRIGIRSVEFRGKDGFWLNGKPYESPLIGANRHQDFAVVGNAVANSIHWRDAKKLRDAGMKVIRNAHCPQDPAFMDACDELGLFVIVNTPGWQFWNDAPEFAQRVYSDIRNLVRRDRNHACVWMWEPILNETWYPEDFAKNTRDIVDQEYPYPYCYSGCDSGARGREHFPVLFTHPSFDGKSWGDKDADPKITYFTREWGDNVDDWSSHNSPSRVARNWGEQPMLIQAQHYANPSYTYTCYDALYRTPRQHVGGCLWHSFDHQRGYHPDPFYGGLMDVFRQPKYSYYMFKAQRSPRKEERLFETGPVVYIAHEMTPFSGKDVTVYSNCDEVRLTFLKDGKTYTYNKPVVKEGMPSPVITFPDVYDFMVDKAMSRKKKQDEVLLRAEGLIDGKVVATHEVHPARRPEKVLLWVDNENVNLKADGSDFVTVVAAIADKSGNIKRLNNYYVKFHVEGEGRILGDAGILANPAPVKWGTAPVLIQSTLKPGKIKVTASVLFEGSQMPVSAVLELESYPAAHPLVYSEKDAVLIAGSSSLQSAGTSAKSAVELEQERILKVQNAQRLKEVEQQQEDFGEKNK